MLVAHTMLALGAIGDERSVNALLEMASGEFKNDYHDFLHRIAARALFAKNGALATSIDGVDRNLLRPAVRRLLKCQGAQARGLVADAVLKKLTFDELSGLWSAMIPAPVLTAVM